MTANARPRLPVGGLARVGIYYLLFGALAAVLVRYVPVVREAVSSGMLAGIGGPGANDVFGAAAAPPVGQALTTSTWYNALLASVSMVGALAIMMPVTWVYMLTRRHRGYEESVVHTLLILPVAVTGIVMVVKSSVALAFSLAGIVAAVRFRTTLDDTKDAVYVFLAIGVGLASGVQAVGVALALSLVFNAVVLVLWKTRFGDTDPPESAALHEASQTSDRATRLERHIAEERSREKGKRANALLFVQAKGAGAAQALVEPLLEELAARWKLAEVTPGADGYRLAYLVRLDGTAAQGALMDRLHPGTGGVIDAAELTSLKGINPAA